MKTLLNLALGCFFLSFNALAAIDQADKEPEKTLATPEEKPAASAEQHHPEEKTADPAPKEEDHDDCGLDAIMDKSAAATEREDIPVRANFTVKFKDEVNPFTVMTTSVLPGEKMELEALLTTPGHTFEAEAEGGNLEKTGKDQWLWTAPDRKGFYCVKVRDREFNSTICINTFVLVPYDGQEVFHGYRIGQYQKKPLKNDPVYTQPKGFIEVTEENQDTWITPHFQLRQFASKQQSSFPKYLVLQTRMLLNLEMLLGQMKEKGVPADSFYIVSAYRTPYYNLSIGNKTAYSRHTYGDAADIFVDVNRDGTIDDLNHDGRSNDGDVQVMLDFVKKAREETWFKPFIGGLGYYPANASRGGFIHVDTRGQAVNW